MELLQNDRPMPPCGIIERPESHEIPSRKLIPKRFFIFHGWPKANFHPNEETDFLLKADSPFIAG
jgi:hypothetical protein